MVGRIPRDVGLATERDGLIKRRHTGCPVVLTGGQDVLVSEESPRVLGPSRSSVKPNHALAAPVPGGGRPAGAIPPGSQVVGTVLAAQRSTS